MSAPKKIIAAAEPCGKVYSDELPPGFSGCYACEREAGHEHHKSGNLAWPAGRSLPDLDQLHDDIARAIDPGAFMGPVEDERQQDARNGAYRVLTLLLERQ